MTLATQSNTQPGPIVALADTDLTDKEGRLCLLNADGEFALPAAITNHTPYLLDVGGAAGSHCEAVPFTGERNRRVRLKGACSSGGILTLAAIAGDDAGKLRALPTAAGTYRGLALAEEDGVDGQLVLCRPYPVGDVVVTE